MLVVALDISTKTGYSVGSIRDGKLILLESGALTKRSEPQGLYPYNYVEWADSCFQDIRELLEKHKPDCVVIEQIVASSHNVLSQIILNWIHYRVASLLSKHPGVCVRYLFPREWRGLCKIKMSKKELDHNKKVRDNKKSSKSAIAKDENGKRIGKIGKKHLSVMKANELFNKNFKLKDNDEAESLLILHAFYLEITNKV